MLNARSLTLTLCVFAVLAACTTTTENTGVGPSGGYLIQLNLCELVVRSDFAGFVDLKQSARQYRVSTGALLPIALVAPRETLRGSASELELPITPLEEPLLASVDGGARTAFAFLDLQNNGGYWSPNAQGLFVSLAGTYVNTGQFRDGITEEQLRLAVAQHATKTAIDECYPPRRDAATAAGGARLPDGGP